MTACLCKEDVDALAGFVCFCSSTIGVELGLASGTVIPFAAGCISPTAVDTLLVNDEMAHPVQDAASLGCVVFILAEEEVVESAALGGGRTVSGNVNPYFRTRCKYASIVLLAESLINFSLSIKQGHIAGKIRFAQSSSEKTSAVTLNAINAAFLAWTNGSRKEREKAAIKTFDLVLAPRFFDIFPRHMVVFVRMPGCSSFAVLARCLRSSPLITLSESLSITVNTAFTVCSRTIGATSVKPVTCGI